MNTETKAPVKPVGEPPVKGVALNQNAQTKVKEATKSATATAPKKEPSPSEILAILGKREKTISENAEKLRGLQRLRKERDALNSWDIENDDQAEIIISGRYHDFKTQNSFIIAVCKETLEETFDKRIAQFEKELATANI